MYDLDEFDACYLDHKSTLDSEKQKYLNLLIELRNYNCSRYYELFVRGTIIQGIKTKISGAMGLKWLL